MPVGDWQFWVVTLLALGGLFIVARPFLPQRRRRRGDRRRVALTVERRRA